jgi:hypothetical protein
MQVQPSQDQDYASEPEPEWSTLLAEGRAEWAKPSPGRIRRFARYFYNRFIRLYGNAVPIAAFFRISKVAAAAAVWLTNPATAPFIYWFNYKLGAKILGYPMQARFLSNPSWETFWYSGKHVFVSLTLGGIITGVILGLVGYFVTLAMVKTAREKARRFRQKRGRQ